MGALKDRIPRNRTLCYDVDREEFFDHDDPNRIGIKKQSQDLLDDVLDPDFGKKPHRSFNQIKVILSLFTFAIYAVFVWALKEYTPEIIFWIFTGIAVPVAVILVWIIWRPGPLEVIEKDGGGEQ
jgi:hypothetical protein